MSTSSISDTLDVSTLSLPARPRVVEIRHQPYVDSLGDDALKVWVVLSEDTPEGDWSAEWINPLDRAIRDALLSSGIELFPYIQYVTAAELEQAGIAH